MAYDHVAVVVVVVVVVVAVVVEGETPKVEILTTVIDSLISLFHSRYFG